MNINATVEVKSTSEFFEKELSGRKNNTVRVVNSKEDKEIQKIVSNIKYITITEKTLHRTLTRKLTDITRYVPNTDTNIIIYIFSW